MIEIINWVKTIAILMCKLKNKIADKLIFYILCIPI